MVSAFMCGIRHLRPECPIGVPSWDLSVVLKGLMAAPFEPLESALEWILTLKVTLLLTLPSPMEFSFLAAVASGLLSWGNLHFQHNHRLDCTDII